MDARRTRMVSAWVLVLAGLVASVGLTSMTEGFNPSDGQNLGITTADRTIVDTGYSWSGYWLV
ncbi:MAG: hypothetical protein ACYTGA_00535 [Planctomycetota bacterium]